MENEMLVDQPPVGGVGSVGAYSADSQAHQLAAINWHSNGQGRQLDDCDEKALLVSNYSRDGSSKMISKKDALETTTSSCKSEGANSDEPRRGEEREREYKREQEQEHKEDQDDDKLKCNQVTMTTTSATIDIKRAQQVSDEKKDAKQNNDDDVENRPLVGEISSGIPTPTSGNVELQMSPSQNQQQQVAGALEPDRASLFGVNQVAGDTTTTPTEPTTSVDVAALGNQALESSPKLMLDLSRIKNDYIYGDDDDHHHHQDCQDLTTTTTFTPFEGQNPVVCASSREDTRNNQAHTLTSLIARIDRVKQEILQLTRQAKKRDHKDMPNMMSSELRSNGEPSICSSSSSSSSSCSSSSSRGHSDDDDDPCDLTPGKLFQPVDLNPGGTGSASMKSQNILTMLEHLTRRRDELRLIDKQLFDMMTDCLCQLNSTGSSTDTTADFCYQQAPVSMVQKAMDLTTTNRQTELPAAIKFNSKKRRLLDAVEADEKLNMSSMNYVAQNQPGEPQSVKKFRPIIGDQQQVFNDVAMMPINYAQPQLDRFNLSSQAINYVQQQTSSLLPSSSSPSTQQPLQMLSFGVSKSTLEASTFNQSDAYNSRVGLSSLMSLQEHQYDHQPTALALSTQHLNKQQQVAGNERIINNTTGTSKQYLSTKDTLELVRATISNQRTTSSSSLAQEQQQMIERANLIAPIVQKMSFRCHVCGSGFEDRHRLQQHLSIHLNLHSSWFEEKTIKETMAQYELRRGDYLCQICQFRFETTAEFDKHMQLHGEKPHQCDLCSQDNNKFVSFRYFRQLLTHLRSHCFLYSCRFVPECKQTANRKDYLKLHILKHHLNNKLPEQYTICCH